MIGVDIGAGDGSFASLSGMDSIISSDRYRPTICGSNGFVQNSAENLPFADGTFDFVTFMYALHHFESKFNAIRETNRVLKPGGFVIIKEEYPRYKGQSRLLRLNERIANEAIYGKTQSSEYVDKVSYFSRAELLAALGGLNFLVKEEFFSKPIRWYEPIYKTKKVLVVAQKMSN